MLSQMVIHCRLPWVTSNVPQTTQNSIGCIAFHIFVVGKHGDFKLGVS